MMKKILNLKARIIDYYKLIFVIIEYDGKIVFMGNLSFEGLV